MTRGGDPLDQGDGRRERHVGEDMAETVADTLVGVLERIGVKQIFALIGNSLNPLADSLRGSSDRMDWRSP